VILIDGRKSTQEIVDEVKLTFFSDVVLEIGPQALKILQAGEGGWQEKHFWMIFAILLAAGYHPKCIKRKVKHRPADSLKRQYNKDVKLLARVARHRPPNGRKSHKYGYDKESIAKETFRRSKSRQPEVWQQLWDSPELAESICEIFGMASRKSTIK